jgi:type IV pilus assembly protein PilX
MQRNPHAGRATRSPSLAQRGVSLIFALLALAAISLAAVALVRSVDGGLLVIGNLGFKQETTRAADRAAETARAWIAANTAELEKDAKAMGYYATASANLDPTGKLTSAARKMDVIDWGDADSCLCTAASSCNACTITPRKVALANSTVTASYVITRLCPAIGTPSALNPCSLPASQEVGVTKDRGDEDYDGKTIGKDGATSPYYRIIVRTVGGRNTVSFTETLVH